MSRILNTKTLDSEKLETIIGDLTVYQEPSKYAFGASPKEIRLYKLEGSSLIVPFSYNKNIPRPERKMFSTINVSFDTELRSEQLKVRNEAISILNNNGSVIISADCGFGKTALAINISTKIKLKTLIICHRLVLINQWKNSIEKFCPNAKVHIITPKSDTIDSDFYIINAINVPKKTRGFYKDIGTLCVDENHLIMADKLSTCMQYITPRYVIGLSATPYRTDGLDVLIDSYFGTEKIIRKLYRKHLVYKVNTGFTPEIKYNKIGKVDWGDIIRQQSENIERNEKIIEIVKKFKDRVFLILCKRVAQANYLLKRLLEENEDTTSLIGKNQEYEQKSRILVGSIQKTGVGFDHPRLDTLLLASDVEQYFIQYLGRVFRRQNVVPIIFDIVDNNPILNKHFRTRSSVYKEYGGDIKDYEE